MVDKKPRPREIRFSKKSHLYLFGAGVVLTSVVLTRLISWAVGLAFGG